MARPLATTTHYGKLCVMKSTYQPDLLLTFFSQSGSLPNGMYSIHFRTVIHKSDSSLLLNEWPSLCVQVTVESSSLLGSTKVDPMEKKRLLLDEYSEHLFAFSGNTSLHIPFPFYYGILVALPKFFLHHPRCYWCFKFWDYFMFLDYQSTWNKAVRYDMDYFPEAESKGHTSLWARPNSLPHNVRNKWGDVRNMLSMVPGT